MRSDLTGADGVVANVKARSYVDGGFTTPSARKKRAQPPLLGEEGKKGLIVAHIQNPRLPKLGVPPRLISAIQS